MNAPATRRRGRPQAYLPAARDHILDSLARLLESQPWTLPSLRSVARHAGISPALVHYHFGDLPGLVRCLFDERAQPLLASALPALPLPADLDASAALVRFLQKWTTLARRQRWLCACLLQSPAYALHPAQPWEPLCALISLAQQRREIRDDLPGGHVALLLLSMGAMPLLARTALGAGLDPAALDVDDASLTLRHLSVLQAGLARAAPGPA